MLSTKLQILFDSIRLNIADTPSKPISVRISIEKGLTAEHEEATVEKLMRLSTHSEYWNEENALFCLMDPIFFEEAQEMPGVESITEDEYYKQKIDRGTSFRHRKWKTKPSYVGRVSPPDSENSNPCPIAKAQHEETAKGMHVPYGSGGPKDKCHQTISGSDRSNTSGVEDGSGKYPERLDLWKDQIKDHSPEKDTSLAQATKTEYEDKKAQLLNA